MKSLNYAAISSLCALAIGILLVVWPEAAIIYLVITVGVLFLLPGLFGLFSYYAASRHKGRNAQVISYCCIGKYFIGILADDNAGIFCKYLNVLAWSAACVRRIVTADKLYICASSGKGTSSFLSGFCVDSGIWCCYSVQSVPGSYRSVYCFGSNSHCICGKRSDSLVVLSPQTE